MHTRARAMQNVLLFANLLWVITCDMYKCVLILLQRSFGFGCYCWKPPTN